MPSHTEMLQFVHWIVGFYSLNTYYTQTTTWDLFHSTTMLKGCFDFAEWIKLKISGQQCEPLVLDKEDRERIDEIKRELLLKNPLMVWCSQENMYRFTQHSVSKQKLFLNLAEEQMDQLFRLKIHRSINWWFYLSYFLFVIFYVSTLMSGQYRSQLKGNCCVISGVYAKECADKFKSEPACFSRTCWQTGSLVVCSGEMSSCECLWWIYSGLWHRLLFLFSPSRARRAQIQRAV